MKFEDRLTQSAKRMAEQDNSTLRVPHNPREKERFNWGWITIPAAVAVGMLIGMSYQLLMTNEYSNPILAKTDTVYVDNGTKDTVFLTKVVEKKQVVEKVVWKERKESTLDNTKHETLQETQEPTCTSIQCDGIKYALLRAF